MHVFQEAVFSRARSLVVVDGMTLTLDDFKAEYAGRNCPVARRMSNDKTGWTADALVTIPEQYVLAIRKRGIVSAGARDKLESATEAVDKLLERLHFGDHRMLLVMDRGYMTVERALSRT